MTSIFSGQRPDLTPAQVVAVIVAGIPIIANLFRAFGLYDVSPEQEHALTETMTWAGVLAGLLVASDAGVRSARNVADSRRDAAALSAPGGPNALPAAFGLDDQLSDDDDDHALAAVLGASGTLPDSPEDEL
jgi:hypothetical protein